MVILITLGALGLAGCGASHSPSTTTHAKPPGHPPPGTGTTPPNTGTTPPGTGPTQPGGGTLGPEGIPIEQGTSLAPATTTTPGTPVDGIGCLPSEQIVYHIHAHLQVDVAGHPRQLPGGIGIIQPVAEQTPEGPLYAASQCYYWLHTHAADGIIHIESPTRRIYTLGEFFDEWRQPLSSDNVAGARGRVTALVDGKTWTKSPRAIPLLPREEVQLEVGMPLLPFVPVSFARTGL